MATFSFKLAKNFFIPAFHLFLSRPFHFPSSPFILLHILWPYFIVFAPSGGLWVASDLIPILQYNFTLGFNLPQYSFPIFPFIWPNPQQKGPLLFGAQLSRCQLRSPFLVRHFSRERKSPLFEEGFSIRKD
jgi:hypothetical protein